MRISGIRRRCAAMRRASGSCPQASPARLNAQGLSSVPCSATGKPKTIPNCTESIAKSRRAISARETQTTILPKSRFTDHSHAKEQALPSDSPQRFQASINYDFSNQRPYLTINFDNGFDDFYFLIMDLKLEEVKLQEDEVQNVKWASREEITEMIDNESFIPYVSTFIDSLFDLKNQRGMIRKYF